MQNIEKSGPSAYVGLIPAAGVGSRLPNRKVAKELLPVGPAKDPAISHLLGHMQRSGICDITAIVRQEKGQLVEYLGDNRWQPMNIRLVSTQGTAGVPQTVALGLESLGLEDIEHRNIAFGFPDILLKPNSVFPPLMQALDTCNADIVLGLFPAARPSKSDMVAINPDSNVIDIEVKPKNTLLTFTWSVAVWRPTFTRYLTSLLTFASIRVNQLAENPADQQMGQIFKLALSAGLVIHSLSFTNGTSLDIGTPDDLALASDWHS